MNINKHLKSYGYRPELSDGLLNKYEDVLFKYLGEDRYRAFDELRESHPGEAGIMNFVGDDMKFLRLVISGQIGASLSILESMVNIIDDEIENPKNILELGGADGWALDFLNQRFKWKSKMTVVDHHSSWKTKNSNIEYVESSYANLEVDSKYDLILSILGAPHEDIAEVLKCIADHIDDDGLAIIGLRISTEDQYIETIKVANKLGLSFVTDLCTKVVSFDEKFPVIVLEKYILELTNGLIISSLRKGFHQLEPMKRIFGFEAKIILDLIADGDQVSISKKDWITGEFMEVEVISKNGINYRKTSNRPGDVLIEYPVEIEDSRNEAENQVQFMHANNIFDNNK